ncbi:RpiR family transcriptional regulator [Salimicrobium jeotgali]|uniref:RpiR family transcriptional regulator n=1 Tax=Salimicrobium jeotgali TaxID=1230341 RepID=K2FLW2_9BACI|nr:MurR/RpiR family transcriptional regulator [Salimicrobium jeotgali]AKG03492.1 RpiR family transcriptional regulator [Salimicrobium jeotgali]EKE31976.1 RpiR family transcriptional regulator [Salimicrobium jeotgali]MBM7695941.1 DNA-binding MurR/RpiR family transcriptional regulator [Salimicrobium jeotgali]
MAAREKRHCLLRIRSEYPQFTQTERRVADYILEKPERIVKGTINEAADDIGIAVSTVFRFCKTMGFKGYQDMKIELASELVGADKEELEDITRTDDEAKVTEKVFRSNIRTMEETLEVLDTSEVAKAVKMLRQADRVEFFGCGGSNIIAQDACHKLLRTGLSVFSQADNHMQLMSASQLKNKDVAVLISHSGTTKDVLDVFHILKSGSVPVIAITNLAKSPLRERSDVVLTTVAEEADYRPQILSSAMSQMSVIDALYVNLLVSGKEESTSAWEKITSALSGKRM